MKISREFSYRMEDESRVVISMEYKPQSMGDKKFGVYYYIIQYFPSKSARLNWVSENSRLDPSWAARYPLSAGVVDIAFYDKTGYSLFKNGQHSTLAPGYNHDADEANEIDGGYEWKGQFGESCITVENFRDIQSVKVEYIYGLQFKEARK